METSDQDLLHRFAGTGDEAAFSVLVERYAALVLGASRRVLGDVQDAEDASQAVFLILAKKAGSIDASATLAPWLHRVAIDMARDVRKARRIREHHHREAAAMPRTQAPDHLGEEIDAALRELPERERSAIILFHLQGRSVAEVANLVHQQEGTICVWLHRGRERLARVLRRRGMAVPATGLLAGLAGLGSVQAAEVPVGFVAATTKAASAFVTGGAATGPTAILAAKGCKTMASVPVLQVVLIAAAALAVLVSVGAFMLPIGSGAPLGSPDFHPSPARPIGWRGDSSGRYPAATPPLEWFRRPTGVFSTLRVSAAQAAETAIAGAPLNMGQVLDWMIAGPFDAKDHESALEDVTLPDEATADAVEGAEFAGRPWTHVMLEPSNQSADRARLVIDLAVAYGKTERQERQNHPGTLEPVVAYASTRIWAGEAGKVVLRLQGTRMQAWLNGAAVKSESDATVALVQGWNRLTLKVASSSKEWNASALFLPLAGTAYETRNIAWMAPMPGQSWSSPIVVGQKIFVNADEGTLVCLDKTDGRTLWTRSTTFYHATTDAERARFADLAGAVDLLDRLMLALPEALNAALSADGVKADVNAALQATIKQKLGLERSIRERMGKADKTYNCWQNNRGWASATPVSDGTRVYVAYYGGCKGVGANAVACFDLEGRRIWGQFTGQTGIYEHGQHSTPALCGDILVYLSGRILFGFDKTTGAIRWQKPVASFGNVEAASPVWVRSGGVDLVFIAKSGLYRCSDGALLWKSEVKDDTVTPALVDGTVYGVNFGFTANETPDSSCYAMRIPAPVGDSVKPEFLFRRPWRDCEIRTPYGTALVGSPLYHDGYLYEVSAGGTLVVVDTATGKLAYNKVLDSLCPRLTWVYTAGVCTGPTLAGAYIHVRDDQSQTLVLAPGPVYRELARNVLWEITDGRQQEAQSNPFYEGGRIYYRTQGFLYCIGER